MIADRSMPQDCLEHFLYRAGVFFGPQLEKAGTTLEQYARKLSEKATIAYVAENNNEIIGLVAGYTHETPDNTSYISQVYVLPECRGRGLSTQLLSEYICYCKEVNLAGVWLTTRKDNFTAQKAYEKAGFVQEEFDSTMLVKYAVYF